MSELNEKDETENQALFKFIISSERRKNEESPVYQCFDCSEEFTTKEQYQEPDLKCPMCGSENIYLTK